MNALSDVKVYRINEFREESKDLVWEGRGFASLSTGLLRRSPTMTFVDVVPEVDVFDADHDRCRIARFEILCPELDWTWWPNIALCGYMRELTAAQGVQYRTYTDRRTKEVTQGEARYVPEPDPNWVPSLVRVRVFPVLPESAS